MKRLKKFMYVFVLIAIQSKAQDPSFSQFFSSPLNINPSLTANINADWRAIANFRDQWITPASPYATGTISYDAKMLQGGQDRRERGKRGAASLAQGGESSQRRLERKAA